MSERRSFIAFGIALLVAVFAGLAVFLLMGGNVGFGSGDDEGLSRASPTPESSASPPPTESVETASASPSPTRTPSPPASTAVDPTPVESTPSPAAGTATASPSASPPTSTPTLEATAPAPSATPQAGPPPTATPSPAAEPTAPPPPPAAEPFSGSWRIVDTVTAGSGAGSTFTFDVVLTQAGSVLRGGGGSIQVVGTVEGNTAQVQFAQPAQGYTGTFTWTLSSADRATGTFTTAGVNSGVSELVRLD